MPECYATSRQEDGGSEIAWYALTIFALRLVAGKNLGEGGVNSVMSSLYKPEKLLVARLFLSVSSRSRPLEAGS